LKVFWKYCVQNTFFQNTFHFTESQNLISFSIIFTMWSSYTHQTCIRIPLRYYSMCFVFKSSWLVKLLPFPFLWLSHPWWQSSWVDTGFSGPPIFQVEVGTRKCLGRSQADVSRQGETRTRSCRQLWWDCIVSSETQDQTNDFFSFDPDSQPLTSQTIDMECIKYLEYKTPNVEMLHLYLTVKKMFVKYNTPTRLLPQWNDFSRTLAWFSRRSAVQWLIKILNSSFCLKQTDICSISKSSSWGVWTVCVSVFVHLFQLWLAYELEMVSSTEHLCANCVLACNIDLNDLHDGQRLVYKHLLV